MNDLDEIKEKIKDLQLRIAVLANYGAKTWERRLGAGVEK